MNITIEKFGYPKTLVAEYRHWVVLLRPQAVTLGSLILAAKADSTAFSNLSSDAFAEQAKVIHDIETALRVAVSYEKINYLMLMMVDPNVHYHVIPRYAGERSFDGVSFIDAGWPKLPDLASARPLSDSEITGQINWLRAKWPGSNPGQTVD